MPAGHSLPPCLPLRNAQHGLQAPALPAGEPAPGAAAAIVGGGLQRGRAAACCGALGQCYGGPAGPRADPRQHGLRHLQKPHPRNAGAVCCLERVHVTTLEQLACEMQVWTALLSVGACIHCVAAGRTILAEASCTACKCETCIMCLVHVSSLWMLSAALRNLHAPCMAAICPSV